MYNSLLSKIVLLVALVSFLSACPGDPLCQQCQNGYCVYCAYSFPNITGICVATAAVPGCYSYASATVCNDCKPGYYQSMTLNTCTVFNATYNAVCYTSFTNTSYCDVCQNRGYYSIDTGTCPTTVTCSDPNCTNCYMYNGAGVCFQCAPGYAVWSSTNIGSTCVAVSAPNCFATNSTTSCLNCNLGAYLSSVGVCSLSEALKYVGILIGQFSMALICSFFLLLG